MYHSVFKYVPSQYFSNAQPQTKNAYDNVILSPAARNAYVDDGKNVVLPSIFQAAGNKASADRTGPIVKLDGSFLDKALTVGARLTMFKTMEESKYEYRYDVLDGDGSPTGEFKTGLVNFTPEYLTAGGGASIDIAKFVPALGPSLKIGGSFMMYNATTGKVEESTTGSNAFKKDSESKLISAELNYNFAPRFSILAGYQQLVTLVKSEVNGQTGAPDAEYTFDNLGVGFGYKVADGGALTVKLTRLSGEGPVGSETKSYEAWQPEVSLTVKF